MGFAPASKTVAIYTSPMTKTDETVTIKAVAILGAGGMMGQGMARNAAAADIPVNAWNRTAAKLDELGGVENVATFATAREAVDGADVIVTMLSDADATIAAMQGPDGGAAGSEGAVWVQMGTLGVEGAERCAELARDRGLGYVDAPVLGTKKPAEEGQLVILASGGGSSRELLEPFFDAIGKRTIWLGAAGEGSKLKVVVNSWLCSIAEGTAEMLRLATALGIEPALVLDALEDGPLEAPYMRMKGEAMVKGDYTPSFKLWLATKDARLAADAGAAAGAEIPVIEAIAAQMEAVAAKHPDEDVAALYRGTRDS
jgi:3-hydroxyisobutyrate dehydrogenase